MIPPANPANEAPRLDCLADYRVLDTPPEPGFDDIARIAAHIFEAPIALVTFVDAERQWFKSHFGLDVTGSPRDISFCGHVVADGELLLVEDAGADPRFADNPFVTGEIGVRFYVGAPLRSPEGLTLGTLCVLDRAPRRPTAAQLEMLSLLARQVTDQLEARRGRRALEVEHASLLASQAQLGEREAFLDALVQGMSEGLVVQARSGEIQSCNPAAERILGLSFDQLRGRTSRDPRWRATHADGSPFPGEQHPAMVALRTGERQVDVPMWLEKPDGTRTTISINVEPLDLDDEGMPRAVVSTFRDTTRKVRALEALAREQAFQTALLDSLPGTAVVLFDGDLRIERIYGTQLPPDRGTPAENIGRAITEVAAPESRAALGAAGRRCLGGERVRMESKRGAKTFEVSLTSFDDGGAGRHGVLVSHDVTEREALRDRVVREERLVATGTLAAGVGHEINNPLTFIQSNLEFALEECASIGGASPSAHVRGLLDALRDAREGTERIRRIVRGLRAMARDDTVKVPLALGPILESSVSLAMHEVRTRARLVLDLTTVPLVLADESSAVQVFVNLIVNAAQSFTTLDVTRNLITVRAALSADGRVEVAVSDNGPGIDPEVLPRIFDPFFSARGSGQGTGLGLSISHSLVTAIGGELRGEPRPGGGTTFRVLLPLAVPVAPDAAPRESALAARGQVLAVDDESALLTVLTRLLRGEHDVVACADPREALRLLEAEPERFDVVFCDLMMPLMSGMELHQRVAEQHPALADRFIFMTGGVTRPEVRSFLDRVPNERMEKPFGVQNLRGIARRLVASRRGPT